ncbi:pyroglutamyl-peptidase I [Rhizobacter sp. J219]|jgi:pyroglutamyl-peptidase|uniref:pyroglutamyl-peptidase I n=1 Tax=Rhizobacter sp. J219 TaxID=2898430 RepID=UPI0021509038|nr:pyroglutamyl-peptidase I [Rhizobacter sp. J219]MCR5882602.1 pyroglutamyl-peptidase I [Rhizobacter sp. J219]
MGGVREPTVLLTGFDPFGGASLNPSWLAVQALHGRLVAGRRVVAARLPTVFDESLTQLGALLDAHAPELVLCVGLANGRRAMSIERVAINLNDASLADNQGARPVDTPVVPHGPTAYFSSLPVKAMLLALQKQGLPVELSQTAGTFVCNHVFYGLMHTLATDPARAGVRGGFVHVPDLDVLALPDLVGGLHLLLDTAVRVRADLPLAAGAVC